MRQDNLEVSSDAVRRTLDYYDRHADEFVARTAGVDMHEVYGPFLALVPSGGHILDAGCGSGRDSLEFLARGCRVTAFDGSAELAKRASERTGLSVYHLTFDMISWQNEFDAVWACASLLHLPRPDISVALKRLAAALKPGGALFASLKAGIYEGDREGRWFTDVTPDALRALINGSVPDLAIIQIWERDDLRPERLGTRWVNLLARQAESR